MTRILLSTSQVDLASVATIAALILVALAAAYLIYYQWRIGKSLTHELAELQKVKKDNVEYEFVLKTMRLSTWHIDVATRKIVFDDDFRDQSDTYIPSMGSELVAAMPEADRQRVLKTIEDLCSGAIDEAHEEYQIVLPQSKKTYWSESYAIVAERDADGRPTRIVGTSQRIDDRKSMEEALITARNRAEESDRMKSAFIANMSHEIRTPLNAIIGFTSILPDVQDPTERESLMGLILENNQKLLRIVDDVVSISKIEAGQDQIVMSAFDLNMVLGNVVQQYQGNVASDVTLTTMFCSAQQMVTTDHNRVEEVLKHLLSNACKFTQHGTIIVGYDEPHDGRIRIWVRDTGKGISEENQQRVFERFFKVDEFIPGAGLGLSTCRTMAYSLGGSVGCTSKLGEGSTFWLEIPMQ